MKKIKCEMCDSTNFVKQDGMFVCQDCGIKYTVEEARKLMVEVEDESVTPVVVTPTPKVEAPVVNNGVSLENYLINARRAFKNGDFEEAERYFNKAEEFSPNCLEAVVYSTLSKAKRTLSVNDIDSRTSVFNVLVNSIDEIKTSFSPAQRDFYKDFLIKLTVDLRMLFGSEYVYKRWYDANKKCYMNNSIATVTLFLKTYDAMIRVINHVMKEDGQYYLYSISEHLSVPLLNLSPDAAKKIIRQNNSFYANKLKNHFWEENKERRASIEEKTIAHLTKMGELDKEIKQNKETQELNRLNNKLKELKDEFAALGLFKIKEKKELKAQIDALETVDIPAAKKAYEEAARNNLKEKERLNGIVRQLEKSLDDIPVTEAKVIIK